MGKVANRRLRKGARGLLRWVFRISLGLFILLLLILLALQFPSVQTTLVNMVTGTIAERTGAEIHVERVGIRFPKAISIQGVYAEDLQGDTLVYADELQVDLRMMALMRNRIDVNRIQLSGTTINMTRLQPDSLFNYAALLQKLSGNREGQSKSPGDAENNPGGSPEETDENSQASWDFNIRNLVLEEIRFRFTDHFSGMDLRVYLQGFQTRIEELDPARMRYYTGTTRLGETRVQLKTSEGSVPPAPREEHDVGDPPDISVGQLFADQIAFEYEDANGFSLSTRLHGLDLKPDLIDFGGMNYALERFLVEEWVTEIIQQADHDGDSAPPVVQGTEGDSDKDYVFRWDQVMPVSVRADLIHLTGVSFSMQNTGGSLSAGDSGFDPSDFNFSGVDVFLENVLASPDTLTMNLNHLSGREAGGFLLQDLSANVALGANSRLQGFSLETGESLLKGDLQTSVSLLNVASEISGNHSLDISFPEAKIGYDLLPFIPGLELLFPGPDSPPLGFGLVAGGRVNDLRVDTLFAEIPEALSAGIHGRIRGLPDMDSAQFDMPGIFLSLFSQPALAYVPDTLHPRGLKMPDSLQVSGNFSGSLRDLAAEAEVSMDFAEMLVSIGYERIEGDLPLWEASLDIVSEKPLAVLEQEDLIRNLSAGFSGSGRGFDPATMDLRMEGRVDSVRYNNYVYRELDISARAEDGDTQLQMAYEDEHLSFNLVNDAVFGESAPVIRFELNLEHLNAMELGLTEDMIAVQSHLQADLDFRVSDFPEGSIRLYDTYLLLDREVFALDTLLVRSAADDNQYSLEISSPLLNGRYSGNISPAGVPGAVMRHMGGYFEENEDSAWESIAFEMAFRMDPSPYVSELLLPQITSYEPFDITAEYDGRERHFFVDVDVPDMHYAGILLHQLTARIDSDPDGLRYSVGLPYLEAGDVILSDIKLGGQVQDQAADFELSFDDRHGIHWLNLAGEVAHAADRTEIRLHSPAVINRQEWSIEPDHLIRFENSALLADNLRIQSESKLFALQSHDPEDPAAPLEFTAENIDLGSFDLIGDQPILTGLLNGQIILFDLFDGPTFTAGLQVDEMGFSEGTVGDVNFDVVNPDPGLFEVTASVRGYGNRLDLSGRYRTDPTPDLDFQLELASLELAPLEAFTAEQVTNMQGNISGSLQVSGNPADPEIFGNIGFQDVLLHVALLNVTYSIPEETISFDRQRIRFDRFSLYDPGDREATLDGFIDYSNLSDPRFGLSLSSRNFLALDLPRGENDLFFGRLLLDIDLSISETLTEPVVEGQLSLNQGSTFAFIVPQTDPEAIGDAGIVEFVAIYDGVFPGLLERELESEPMMAPFQNLDLSVNVEIDPRTRVLIILDEVAGDQLEARGGGQITYGIDPGGRINLAGRYELTGGSYQLTFHDVVRRNFQIQRGGHIVWTGDPLEADVDITAVYSIRTSPAELMLSHSVGQPDQARRQQYPFEVLLNMEGALMQPEISFEIRLPQEHRGAMDGRLQARLNELNQNESDLNKQVFALLIMGNFIQDDPLAAVGAGPGLTSTARTSASSILSQQLNRLSDRYVRGVDISFDLTSYEVLDNGQVAGRTELEMEVSRDFLDERLRITAGGNIELEDETRRQVNPSDIAGDFSVEYLLTPDGRFTLRGYRERKYQDIYDGELVETGLSVIFRQTYTTFRELFMRKEEETLLPENTNE